MGRVFRHLLAAGLVVGVLAGCGGEDPPPAPSTGAAASPSPSQSASASPSTSPAVTAASSAATVRYVFPVDGKNSYAREHHDYPASDIIAACGTVVRAVTDGVVLEVTRVDNFDKSTSGGDERGGLSVSMAGDDGVRYYGSHFSSIDQTVQPGVRVAAGTRLGLVGKTGNANNTCHLHLGISPLCARTGDWWIRRGVVWPWSYLDAWKTGQPKSPTTEVAAWQQTHGCPPEPKNA
jgi:murein DD-endopeptidase MepM/ murein hydrolase activator NlpD